MKYYFVKGVLKSSPRFRAFVGEGEGGTTEENKGTETEGGKGTEEGKGGEGGKGEEEDKPKFSQKQLNKILADDRRKHEERVNKTIGQLEDLKKTKSLSDEEKKRLTAQIEELQNSLLTKEEQAKKEKEKLEKEHRKTMESLSTEKDFWKNQYTQETTRNQIITAAQEHKAVRSEQLIELLEPKTRLVEVLDNDGNGTGKYVPKIKYKTLNDKNEAIELDLTIQETVKRMKDEPGRFGNLFESGLQGGLGGNGSAGGNNTNSGQPPTDPALYRKWREQNLKVRK